MSGLQSSKICSSSSKVHLHSCRRLKHLFNSYDLYGESG